MSVLFDRKYGGQEIDHSVDTGAAIEAAIRARDREVIAEAKRVVHGVHSFGDIPENCECTYCDALDAILKEKE